MSQTSTTNVRSMTGQGHAQSQSDLGTISVEVRTVNHRGFKCSPRTSEGLSPLDSRIEALVRDWIHRGSVHLTVNWRQPPGRGLPQIDTAALESYYRSLKQVRTALDETDAPVDLTSLISLPGVMVPAAQNRRDLEPLWELVQQAVRQALEKLNEMRTIEGASMAAKLHQECGDIEDRLEAISKRAPRAVDRYRARLQSKIERALAEHEIEVQTVDLLREVQLYADRADISEEITRLASHLKMFLSVLGGEKDASGAPEPSGRKLDFITQEMFRETNTIGSKAADAEISSHVVEIKCAIERMRELVQNIE